MLYSRVALDIDECAEGTHTCEDKPCINLYGTYKCRCPNGFDFNETVLWFFFLFCEII